MPLASISNFTDSEGIPRGAGGNRWGRNGRSVLLSTAMGRSPCKTWISTAGWLSAAVENTWPFDVGMVVFLSRSVPVLTLAQSLDPQREGVTSKAKRSFTSPPRTPPWIGSAQATRIHQGWRRLYGPSFPKRFFLASALAGIREELPTRIILSMSEAESPASCIACLVGPMVFSHQVLGEFIKFGPGQSNIHMFRPSAEAVIKVPDNGGHDAGKFNLSFFRSFFQTLHRHFVLKDQCLRLF